MRLWRMTNVPIPEAHLTAVLGGLAMDFVERRPLGVGRASRRAAGGCTAVLGIVLAGRGPSQRRVRSMSRARSDS